MPDELRSFEPVCPAVEGVEGKRSGPSCGGRNHQAGEVSSVLAVTTGCACDIASRLEHELFGGDQFVQHRRNAVTGKIDRLARGPRRTPPSPAAHKAAALSCQVRHEAPAAPPPALRRQPPGSQPERSYRARSLAASACCDCLIHLLDGHRRTGIPECTIQTTNGPHRDDPHLVVQVDVTHPAARLHAECLAYWWPSRNPVLRAGSTEAFSVTGSGPRIAAVSTGTCFAWRPHAASLPTTRKWLAGVLNPWAGTGEDGRADPLHPDWNDVGERDVERLRALETKRAERPESLDGSAHVGRESHRAECFCSRGLDVLSARP